jgi:putative membrane protein
MLGSFTGMVPGIHINTISFLLLIFPQDSSLFPVLVIASMSITHTFVDFIPAIVLGAPDGDSFLAMLPGHRMLMRGEGLYAVKLTLLGSVSGLLISLIFIPFFVVAVVRNGDALVSAIPLILAAVLIMMFFSVRDLRGFFWSAAVILLSGSLGLISLNSFTNAIFPLATGFFGGATILYSFARPGRATPQKLSNGRYNPSEIFSSFLGVAAGSFVALVPALGASNAAFILSRFLGRIKSSSYLVVLGSINTSAMLFSFITLWLIGKARTGSALAVQNLISVDFDVVLLLLAAFLFSGSLAFFITDSLSRMMLRRIASLDYRRLNALVFGILTCLTVALTGLYGLLLFFTASAVGLIANSTATRRSNCMAFLIIPLLLHYLRLA